MRRLLNHFALWALVAFAVLLYPREARANQSASGFCEAGAQVVVTSGLQSTNLIQASFPQCQVQVLVHGGGAAILFADNVGTPLANPFVAGLGGQWQFYAAQGRYDVILSGAGMPVPVIISDVLLVDPAAGEVLANPVLNGPTLNNANVTGNVALKAPSFLAVRYVECAGGSDTNDGLSEGTAFLTWPAAIASLATLNGANPNYGLIISGPATCPVTSSIVIPASISIWAPNTGFTTSTAGIPIFTLGSPTAALGHQQITLGSLVGPGTAASPGTTDGILCQNAFQNQVTIGIIQGFRYGFHALTSTGGACSDNQFRVGVFNGGGTAIYFDPASPAGNGEQGDRFWTTVFNFNNGWSTHGVMGASLDNLEYFAGTIDNGGVMGSTDILDNSGECADPNGNMFELVFSRPSVSTFSACDTVFNEAGPSALSTQFIVSKSSNYTLTSLDSWVNVTGTTTITLPHIISGKRWHVQNTGTGFVTLSPDSGSLNGTGTLGPGMGAEITCDGTNCQSGGNAVVSGPVTGVSSLNLYVATTGTNTGNCQNVAAPCLTLQFAVNQAVLLDAGNGNQPIIINVAAGTYTAGFIINGANRGGSNGVNNGNEQIVINGAAAATTIIADASSAAACIIAQNGARLGIENVTISSTNGNGIFPSYGARIDIIGPVTFGNVGSTFDQIHAETNGAVLISSNYTIANSSAVNSHAKAIFGGQIINTEASRTITLTGSPVFSGEAFAVARVNGNLYFPSAFVTFSGSAGATTFRYKADFGGQIQTNAGAANFFPGTNPGYQLAGGQYSPTPTPTLGALSAGFGSTAAGALTASSNDYAGEVQVTLGGTGQTATGTFTLTFNGVFQPHGGSCNLTMKNSTAALSTQAALSGAVSGEVYTVTLNNNATNIPASGIFFIDWTCQSF